MNTVRFKKAMRKYLTRDLLENVNPDFKHVFSKLYELPS